MPLQNRVTPCGEIVAVAERGTMFGNRGLLHDAQRRIVRPFQVQRWLICLLAFKGRHRPIMQPGQYTELFFLDEATALAAGHRPCAECRRQAYDHFRRCWATAHSDPGSKLPAAGELDEALHRDRLTAAKTKQTHRAEIAALPDGVFLLHDGAAWLLWGAAMLHWTPGGYDRHVSRPKDGQVAVLTPQATVRTMVAGYVPGIHPSLTSFAAIGQSGARQD